MLRRAASTTLTSSKTRGKGVWRKWWSLNTSLSFSSSSSREEEAVVSRVFSRHFCKFFDGIGSRHHHHPSRRNVLFVETRNRTSSSSSSYSTETTSSDKSSWFAPIIGTLGVALGCVTLGMEHQKRTERALREAAATTTQTTTTQTTTTESTPPTRSEKKKEKKVLLKFNALRLADLANAALIWLYLAKTSVQYICQYRNRKMKFNAHI